MRSVATKYSARKNSKSICIVGLRACRGSDNYDILTHCVYRQYMHKNKRAGCFVCTILWPLMLLNTRSLLFVVQLNIIGIITVHT